MSADEIELLKVRSEGRVEMTKALFGGVRKVAGLDGQPLHLVYHFKRTRIQKRQFFAPFYFEGRLQTARASSLKRASGFMWERPALQVVPLLMALVAVGLPLWMLVSAVYWPYWLVAGAMQAWSRRQWEIRKPK